MKKTHLKHFGDMFTKVCHNFGIILGIIFTLAGLTYIHLEERRMTD